MVQAVAYRLETVELRGDIRTILLLTAAQRKTGRMQPNQSTRLMRMRG